MIDGKRLAAIPVMIQLSLIMLPNHEGFFFSDLTFFLFSVVFMLFERKCTAFTTIFTAVKLISWI